ncbi:hypothetical protein SteCoe_2493 [Stentor coeruleus]|uniref:Uncharacterized protein n=1 Tax=Stentor coeruleus TaxID=5963 RepID=A0A1R2CZ64_9CILI|nr:hypothetical protein SteCoe_2493 [Stentor coeruleus]
MAYPPFPLEAAFRQDIEAIAENDDLQFMKKHYLFVNKYKCKQEKQPEQCIEDGRALYTQFVHGTKIAKQKAFYCLSACKEETCYEQCKDALRSTISGLTVKMDPVMNGYLLSFAPK